MSNDEDHVRVTHRVPENQRDAAQSNTSHGELSELVRELYERKANPNDVTDLEDINARLRELRGDRDEKRAELRRTTERLETEIESLEVTIARLEERKDDARSREDVFEGALDQLVTHVENGGRIWPTYPGVESAAETIGQPPEYVINEVRKHAEGVDEDQFQEGGESDKTQRGGLR